VSAAHSRGRARRTSAPGASACAPSSPPPPTHRVLGFCSALCEGAGGGEVSWERVAPRRASLLLPARVGRAHAPRSPRRRSCLRRCRRRAHDRRPAPARRGARARHPARRKNKPHACAQCAPRHARALNPASTHRDVGRGRVARGLHGVQRRASNLGRRTEQAAVDLRGRASETLVRARHETRHRAPRVTNTWPPSPRRARDPPTRLPGAPLCFCSFTCTSCAWESTEEPCP